MPPWLRRCAPIVVALIAIAYAYQALPSAEPFGRDWRLLAELARSADAAGTPAHELLDLRGPSAAAAASLRASFAIHGGERAALDVVGPMRLEQLGMLVLACVFVAWFARRALEPWVGADQARATGWATALFFAVFPLNFPLVASLSSRGEALALLFAAGSAAAFLFGRQEQRFGMLVLAAALAMLAGASSSIAIALPFALALSEYSSARRQRARPARARTAAVTAIAFGAAVAAQSVLAWSLGRGDGLGGAAIALGDVVARPGVALGVLLEKLGVLVLPINAWGLGVFGQAIAVAFLLLAAQPGLVAARTAPRLWRNLGLALGFGLLASLCLDPTVRVSSRDLGAADTLALAALVWCAAIAAATTALSGARRVILPCIVALGFAFLAHGNSLPWVRGSQALARLRAELVGARVAHGYESHLLVVDPPSRWMGVDVVADSIAHIADRMLDRSSAQDVPAEPDAARVRPIARRALAQFARTDDFRALAAGSLYLFEPLPSAATDADASTTGFGPRGVRAVSAPTASTGSRSWYRSGSSPTLDLAPLENLALVVRAPEDADTSRPPSVGWRSKLDGDARATFDGAWLSAEPQPRAIFDLAMSSDWLCAERIARAWSATGWGEMIEAEFRAHLPELVAGGGEGERFAIDGSDWILEVAAPRLTPQESSRARFVLTLLDLDELDSREIVCATPTGTRLRAPAAERALDELAGSLGGLRAAWSVECRLDDVAVARSAGALTR